MMLYSKAIRDHLYPPAQPNIQTVLLEALGISAHNCLSAKISMTPDHITVDVEYYIPPFDVVDDKLSTALKRYNLKVSEDQVWDERAYPTISGK